MAIRIRCILDIILRVERPRNGLIREAARSRTPLPCEAIAWLLLALQLLSILVGVIANAISTPAHPVHVDAGFSVNGWLAVLLTFILARVFSAGALMREDLEGTV